MKQQFHFNLDVAKTEERDGRAYITVYATDSAPDKLGEACSEECLHSLAEQFKSGQVELLNTHNDAIGFGRAVNGWVVDAEQFHPELAGQGVKAVLAEVELDLDFPHARRLFERAQDPEERKRLGFSIYGRLNTANPRRVVWRGGKRVFNDLLCDHISATRFNREANGRTGIAEAVMKSLEWSGADLDAMQKEQAPYTVADLAKQYGLPLGPDVVKKSLREAFFSGMTSESGRDKHTHEFVASLDGVAGTLRGLTENPSAGDRHFHVIDLMDADDMLTAGASRGSDHRHSLGIGSIRQITQDEFAKLVAVEDGTQVTTEDEEVKEHITRPAETVATHTIPSGAPAMAASPKPEAPTPAQAEYHKELGWLQSFRDTLGSLFGKHAPAHEIIENLASAIGPNFAKEGGDIEAMAKAVITLNQRVAGIHVEREGLTVRTAKLFDVFDSAGMLKRLAEPVFTGEEARESATEAADHQEHVYVAGTPKEEPAAEDHDGSDAGAEAEDGAPSGAAQPAAEAAEGEDIMLTAEQIAQMEERLAAKVTTDLLDKFRTAGLLPAEGDMPATHVAATTEIGKPDGEPGGEDAGGEDGNAGDEDTTETSEGEEDEPLSRILASLDMVSKAVGDLSGRLDKIEGAPAGRRSQEGHEDGAAVKQGVFKGVFSGRT